MPGRNLGKLLRHGLQRTVVDKEQLARQGVFTEDGIEPLDKELRPGRHYSLYGESAARKTPWLQFDQGRF